ncbi:MAG: iron-containing alcohol dehydrogenase [Hyphomicrobiales bacterium]|nr:iron-containing alcohol dehydrogenase [Hyphomicrobiales bacterium]
MSRYELAPTPHIVAGQGSREVLGELAASHVGAKGKALLVADPGLEATGMIDEIRAVLGKSLGTVEVFTAFSGDPTVTQTDAAASVARRSGVEVVVALGGGSALDLGKAVAAIAGESRSAIDYELGKRQFPAKRLPAICVPTTSGTGSETTRTAVLTREDGAKTWLWGDAVKSAAGVLDPELTRSLPATLTAATGIDALVHAVEAATSRNANAANNLYAHAAIELVARHLERAVSHPDDIAAREGMQRAAMLAGIAIDNAGTGIAHNIGHAMGSLRKIHHGRAVGIAMLASFPWNTEEDDGRFAACGRAMGAKSSATGFADAYERLLRACGLKVSVADEFAGISAEELARQMARPENASMRASNRREASEADLCRLAERVLAQA